MNIHWLGDPTCHDPQRVGGKAAQLSRLAASYPIPPGFCVTGNISLPGCAASRRISPSLAAEIKQAYAQLGRRCRLSQPTLPTWPAVAVRSSAVDEDGQQTSFAGQHETYLNITDPEALIEAVELCLESAYSPRALHYRRAHGLPPEPTIAVLIQQLVYSDVSAVVFSADPRGSRAAGCNHIIINATWGLGESLVSGAVTPDLYVVRKHDLRLLERQVASKDCMTVLQASGTRQAPTPRLMREEPTLKDHQALELARLALTLEKRCGWAVDLECAFAHEHLYLLQCRPITTMNYQRTTRSAIWPGVTVTA